MKFLLFIIILLFSNPCAAQQNRVPDSLARLAVDKMRAIYREIDQSDSPELIKQDLFFKEVKKYITANPTDFLSAELIAWNKYLDSTGINVLFNLLDPSLQERARVIINRQKIRASIQKRQPFPAVKISDTSGIPFDIARLKGKLVLIDIWASWCGPCRAEMPQLKVLYEKYRAAGFVVVAISMDDNRKKWLAAVSADGQPWLQFCELQPWRNNSWFRDLGVDGVPYNFLIGRDGKLIDKEINMENLESYLSKY